MLRNTDTKKEMSDDISLSFILNQVAHTAKANAPDITLLNHLCFFFIGDFLSFIIYVTLSNTW